MLRSVLVLAVLATATPVQAGRLFGRRAACQSCQSSAAQKAATQKATQKATKPQRIRLFRRGR